MSNQWEIEDLGFTSLSISYDIKELLDGTTISDLIDSIDKLKEVFGENFERLYELERKYDGGHKHYFKEIKKGRCRCGSCLDIYEWWICVQG